MYCIKYILFIHTYIKSNNLLDEVAKPDVIEYDIVSINTQVNIAQQSQAYGIPEPPPTSAALFAIQEYKVLLRPV